MRSTSCLERSKQTATLPAQRKTRCRPRAHTLIYPGLINIGISRLIRQGHSSALAMSAVVTTPLLVYHELLVPAHHSNQIFGVIIHGFYLCFLMPVWISTI